MYLPVLCFLHSSGISANQDTSWSLRQPPSANPDAALMLKMSSTRAVPGLAGAGRLDAPSDTGDLCLLSTQLFEAAKWRGLHCGCQAGHRKTVGQSDLRSVNW